MNGSQARENAAHSVGDADAALPQLESVGLVSTAAGAHWEAHAHNAHELLSAITHTVTVVTDAAVYVAPRGTSVWIPAYARHEVTAAPGNRMRCSWFAVSPESTFSHEVVITQTPRLLDDVLAHVMRATDPAARRRGEAFAIDLLRESESPHDGLDVPSSPLLRAVTDALVADPADRRTVAALAASVALSVRTFTRQFAGEVGMPFSEWRTELRMRIAMSALLEGRSVSEVARAVGFESLAAFSAAFRKHTGMTPSGFAEMPSVADTQYDSTEIHKKPTRFGGAI